MGFTVKSPSEPQLCSNRHADRGARGGEREGERGGGQRRLLFGVLFSFIPYLSLHYKLHVTTTLQPSNHKFEQRFQVLFSQFNKSASLHVYVFVIRQQGKNRLRFLRSKAGAESP